jgi:hypothetical protein
VTRHAIHGFGNILENEMKVHFVPLWLSRGTTSGGATQHTKKNKGTDSSLVGVKKSAEVDDVWMRKHTHYL